MISSDVHLHNPQKSLLGLHGTGDNPNIGEVMCIRGRIWRFWELWHYRK